jgi:hypothetical protein
VLACPLLSTVDIRCKTLFGVFDVSQVFVKNPTAQWGHIRHLRFDALNSEKYLDMLSRLCPNIETLSFGGLLENAKPDQARKSCLSMISRCLYLKKIQLKLTKRDHFESMLWPRTCLCDNFFKEIPPCEWLCTCIKERPTQIFSSVHRDVPQHPFENCCFQCAV